MFEFLFSSGGHRAQAVVLAGATPVRLVAGAGVGRQRIYQNQGTAAVYLGPSDVTASGPKAGYALASGETFSDNASGEPWYGVTAGDDVPVVVIEVY